MIKFLKTTARIAKYFLYLLTILIVLATVYIVITINLSDDEERWTYKAFTVLSDSMQDTFASGDVVIIKKTDVETIEVGDIIAFYSIDPYIEGEIVTHKIKEITSYNGELAFTTYGTTTGDSDLYPALAENVIGKLFYIVPNIGNFTQFAQSKNGYILVIVIPILICLFLEIRHLISLTKKKNEQITDENTEKLTEETDENTEELTEETQEKTAKQPLFSRFKKTKYKAKH